MAAARGRKIYRVSRNARRVIGPVLAILVLLGIVILVDLAEVHDNGWPWTVGGAAIILLFWWASGKGLGSRAIRLLSERAVKNDLAWAALWPVLWAARRIRAVFAWDRLALPLGFLLTAAVTYRLAALPALLARGTGESSADLVLLVLDWLLFGLGYGAVGLAAPVVAALLLLRRRKSSLAAANVLHLLALFGSVLVAFRLVVLAGFMEPLGVTASLAEIAHPVFALGEGHRQLAGPPFADLLVGFLALYLLSRPRVLRYYDDQGLSRPKAQARSPAA